MLLREKIEQIRKAFPNHSALGQMFADKRDTRTRFKRITLWTLFRSEEGKHSLRQHMFSRKEFNGAESWANWLRTHYDGKILPNILSGLKIRTGVFWTAAHQLGWHGEKEFAERKRAKPKSKRPKVAKGRNKTKRKGRKSGQNHIRRRHRNRRR